MKKRKQGDRLIEAVEKIVHAPGDVGECAVGYRIGISIPENKLRIILCRADGSSIGHMEFNSADAYGFTDHILKGYDKLEGIK